MRSQSAFQIFLGLGSLGVCVAANVFWPFAHDSYIIGVFAAFLYMVCGWTNYRVAADKSRIPAEVGAALGVTLVTVAVDFLLLAQCANNLVVFFTQFLRLHVDWYKDHPLVHRDAGVLVLALDASLAGLTFIHLVTATVSAGKLRFQMYIRDEDSLIRAYSMSSPQMSVSQMTGPQIVRGFSYHRRQHDADINAMMSNPYATRPHPLYPPRQQGEGLPRVTISYPPPPPPPPPIKEPQM